MLDADAYIKESTDEICIKLLAHYTFCSVEIVKTRMFNDINVLNKT